jgi:enoyl-CoA hydratase
MVLLKKNENSPVAISKAIKAVNANFKDGGYKTEINRLENALVQKILKKELQPFREKKRLFPGNKNRILLRN